MKLKEYFHETFLITIVFKFIDGLLECMGAAILIFVNSDTITTFVYQFFAHELAQDPTDIIANLIINATNQLSLGSVSFASLYLLIHGVIKLFLSTGLLLKKMWIYPLAGTTLSVFIVYQCIHLFSHYTHILLLLTIVDAIIVFLLHSEYIRITKTSSDT